MRIRVEVKSNRYLYLWIKYVIGFDIAKHCAKCLLGKYSKLIPYRSQTSGRVYEGVLNEHEAPYLYLCGVTPIHSENLHIAFQFSAGETIDYEDENIQVRITDAKRLPIPPTMKNFPLSFNTCRNFQFGYHYFYDARGGMRV